MDESKKRSKDMKEGQITLRRTEINGMRFEPYRSHVSLKVKKLAENAIVPTYATSYAAGMDLYSIDDATIKPGDTIVIHTGIVMEIPLNFVGLICARSGISIKNGIAPANKVGVIDSDYRGEILVALHNHSNKEYTVNTGDRIAQMIISPYFMANISVVENLKSTDRDNGGLGSTGK